MNITYNDITQPSNLITFTDVPNILKVEDTDGGGNAEFYISIIAPFNDITTTNTQWYIKFLGDSVTNTVTPENAINKSFYVSSSMTSTAASIAKAFRNCSTVSANFVVEYTEYNNNPAIKFTARAFGPVLEDYTSKYGAYFDTNIDSTYITSNGVDGYANSDLYGASIDADIYSMGNYVTTLTKNYYGGEAAFNLSPVLTTFAEYGITVPYTVRLSSTKNGEYSVLGEVDENHISIGYMCNQGNKFLFNNSMAIAQNYSRGEAKDTDNNTILYIYQPSIPISCYFGNVAGMTVKIEYLNSAKEVIFTYTTNWRKQYRSSKLFDFEYQLNHSGSAYFPQAFYIDLTLGSTTIRYNVIKPLKATEYSQRVLWRNSYGGISFFDFTGQKTETRDVEVQTYEKNIFNYYTDPLNELEKVYDNKVKYSVTLKSHLFEEDGKYIFNDLLQSANVWTNINGQEYAIIIDSINVEETDNNGIYQATLKYHYSAEPSLI